jgi:hypothetical protein
MYSPGIGIKIVPRMSVTSVSVVTATVATGIGATSFTANWNPYSGAQYYLLDVSTSSSFSSFILQNQVVSTNSYLVTGLTANTTYYYRVRASTDPDPDYVSFYNRVVAAGGSLTTTEQSATLQLVLDLKANSLWTPMKAIYPMVGSSAAACAQNLKSSSFTGTFTSGWTFASTGATPNGTSAYMNIGLNPSMVLTNNNYHLSHYSLTQKTTGTEVDFAAISPSPVMISLAQYYQGVGKGFVAGDYIVSAIAVLGATNTRGFQVNTRSSQTSAKMFLNNSQVGSTLTLSNTNPLPNANMSLGSNNNGGSYYEYSSKQCAFASIGDGLTDTQASNFYTAVQAFQTTLNRQVV